MDVLGASDCEQLGSGWLVQPVNAISSLVFIPVGGWLAGRSRRRSGWRRPEMLAVGAVVVANGIGSFAYHGPQPSWAKVAHDVPIPALVALLAANELGRVFDPVEDRTDRDRERARWALALSAATLLAGVEAWMLGQTTSSACRPESLFQWHAAWHVLVAVSAAVAVEGRIERG
jgi:hypothetical protein